MPQCPDCDSIRIFCDPPEGNGRCSVCHGTGLGGLFDSTVLPILNGERPGCEECCGSGKCQTCTGTGVVAEEYEISIAA